MKNCRILYVDDEPNILEGLERVMHRKCTLLAGTSGEDAPTLARGARAVVQPIVCELPLADENDTAAVT